MTYARRTDTTQQAIAKALRKCGYVVEIMREPVDLVVRHSRWPWNVWCMGDAKTPNRKGGKYAPRADQKDQQQFCREHGVPYWPSVESALEYLARFEASLRFRETVFTGGG